jgi:hypothetical protein
MFTFDISNKRRLYLGDFVNYQNYLRQKKSAWDLKNVSDFSNILNVDLEKADADFFTANYYGVRYKKYMITSKTLLNNVLLKGFNSGIQSLVADSNMYSDFAESSRLVKRTQGVGLPVRLIKYPFGLDFTDNYHVSSDETLNTDLFRFRFNDGENKIVHKVVPHTTYLTLKQKRYKRKKVIPAQVKYYQDAQGNKTKKVRYSGKPILFNNAIFEDSNLDPTVMYRMMKKNKKRSDLIPVNLAKRILRVKKTLILPAHVNITLITNSYDIVHS